MSLASRSTQQVESGDSEEARVEESESHVTDEPGQQMERLIGEMIQSRTAELQAELSTLGDQLEEVENFARIGLNEHKIKQNEVNLAEFSDSLTGFAEKAFNNINAIEDQLNTQSLLLAAILDALSEDGVELDLSEVAKYQEENVVVDASPEERLVDALEQY